MGPPAARCPSNAHRPSGTGASIKSKKPRCVRLFVKPGCCWCDEAREGLRMRGIPFQESDVITQPGAMQEMKQLTGQTRAPSLVIDGQVPAHFGAHELDVWWVKMGFEETT